jgi:hypothetical protein
MKTLTTITVSAVASALTLPASALAHHPGGAGNTAGTGPINTISATTLDKGETVVGVTFEYTGLGGINDSDLREAAEHAHEEGHDGHAHSMASIVAPSANIAYGLTDDLTLALRLPYVIRHDIREGHKHDHHDPAEVHYRGDSSGFGDISALAQWRFFNDPASRTEAALVLGVKAPTGRTDVEDSNGEDFEAEFLPGSGSWDGMFGFALTQRVGAWSFDASGLYTLVGTGEFDTDLGDRLYYNIAASYRIMGAAPHAHVGGSHGPHDHDSAVDLVLELNGEWHDYQEIDGEKDPNSGGHTLYISPGVRISEGAWSGFVSVGIPIVDEVNGIQSDPDFRVVTGASVGF